MISVPLRRRGPPVDRAQDRVIAATSIAFAVLFLLAAGLALFLPEAVRRGLWLSIHLALAGAATTAVAGVMPFFVAAFAAAPPADPRLRASAVAATAAGALGVVGGVVGGAGGLSTVGGAVFVGAIVLIGIATLRPIGAGLGPARGLVTRSYVLALVAVGTGASLATLLLAGWPPVASSWFHLKPAHAWLNLFGFASLVIATTLLHFFPTVVGTRIPNHRSGRTAVAALAAGSWLAAAGYAFSIDLLASLGGAVAIFGGLALALYLARVWRSRGRWTTDHAWHRFAIWGLVSATGWLLVGLAIAGARAVVFGANPAGWSMGDIVAPLVGGWVTFALLASATHLLPAVGPGDLAAHARQRQVLGRLALPRLIALDLGVAFLTVGQLAGWTPALVAGLALLGVGVAATAALLASAVRTGIQSARRQVSGDHGG